MVMFEFEYKNEKYKRINGYWYDSHNMQVWKALQSELNENYKEDIDFDSLDVNELIDLADEYKYAERYGKALEVYNKALEVNDFEITKSISSRITSCYRKTGRSAEAISFYMIMKKKYGDRISTPILLTSIAGAYMDVGDYYEAQRVAKIAYAKSNGNASYELQNVFNKLNKYFE